METNKGIAASICLKDLPSGHNLLIEGDYKVLRNPDPSSETPHRSVLLEHLQGQSVTMLKAATAAMSFRNPGTPVVVSELAGACLAFSGADVPFTRAVGVGTSGPLDIRDVEAVEEFYKSRRSPVRIVISERTHFSLAEILKTRGYESSGFLQNWWLPLEPRKAIAPPDGIEIVPAGTNEADLWARTVAAGFEEEDHPIDERQIPERVLDTFYCLGFANGAQPFFAKLQGYVVGGGVLHITGALASIRTASCRIEHRNKGVQGALITARLDAAVKAECGFAFSSTDKPGTSSRNLQQFGFKTLSTSFTMCLPH